MSNRSNIMVHGSGIAAVREYTPAETGFDDLAITSASTYNSSVLDVSGYVAFNVSFSVTNDGGSDTTQGSWTLYLTGYAADGSTVVIPSQAISAQNGNLTDNEVFVTSWVEGDTGDGVNVTSVDCKHLVALEKIKLSLTVATGYDNGPWTASMYVIASR